MTTISKHPAANSLGAVTIAVWRDQQGKRGRLLGTCTFTPEHGWRFYPDIEGKRISRARKTWEETLPYWTGGLDGTMSRYVTYNKGRMIELDCTDAAPVWEA
jgi:hypothetical protein